MHAPPRWHQLPRIARHVLLWFVLSLGAGIASPLVHGKDLQPICSAAGSVKLVSASNGNAGTSGGHLLDCPLCGGPGALPVHTADAAAVAPAALRLCPSRQAPRPARAAAAPPPARGPPSPLT